MNRRKYTILATFVGLLFTAALTFGQAKSEGTKPQRAHVLLRFAKDATLSTNCSETLGLITQSMLQVEGVKNVKLDAKDNGIQVSYDPGKTTPQKIVVAFNEENPDTTLQLSDTGRRKGRCEVMRRVDLTPSGEIAAGLLALESRRRLEEDRFPGTGSLRERRGQNDDAQALDDSRSGSLGMR